MAQAKTSKHVFAGFRAHVWRCGALSNSHRITDRLRHADQILRCCTNSRGLVCVLSPGSFLLGYTLYPVTSVAHQEPPSYSNSPSPCFHSHIIPLCTHAPISTHLSYFHLPPAPLPCKNHIKQNSTFLLARSQYRSYNTLQPLPNQVQPPLTQQPLTPWGPIIPLAHSNLSEQHQRMMKSPPPTLSPWVGFIFFFSVGDWKS